jgi:hypothetical protein
MPKCQFLPPRAQIDYQLEGETYSYKTVTQRIEVRPAPSLDIRYEIADTKMLKKVTSTLIQPIRHVAAPINSVDMACMRMTGIQLSEPSGVRVDRCAYVSFITPTRKHWSSMFEFLHDNLDTLRSYVIEVEPQEVNHTLRLILDHATAYKEGDQKHIELAFR